MNRSETKALTIEVLWHISHRTPPTRSGMYIICRLPVNPVNYLADKTDENYDEYESRIRRYAESGIAHYSTEYHKWYSDEENEHEIKEPDFWAKFPMAPHITREMLNWEWIES